MTTQDISPSLEGAEVARSLLRTRKPGHALPGAFYTDPALYALDIAAIFEREWIFAGATCEIPNPGNFLTVTIGRSPILVIRDRSGEIRAFFNSCRHRGFKICEASRGHTPALICPYHRWTYRLDGTLAHARHMPEEFRTEEFPLLAVHVRTVGGTIYVCLAEEPPDFAPFHDAIAQQLAPHDLEHAKLAFEADLTEYGNWKNVMDNSRECYHCATGHDELMRTFLDIYDFANPGDAALVQAYWKKWESAGHPATVTESPTHRATRLPLTRASQSMTMDGKPAVRLPLGFAPPDAYGSLRWVHYPSTFNHCLNDYTVLVRILPVGPEETLVTTKFLVAADAVEGVDYDLDNLIKVWTVTNDQDKALVERNQVGIASRGYRPGPYSPTLEAGLIKFSNWYCNRIQDYLDRPMREGAAP